MSAPALASAFAEHYLHPAKWPTRGNAGCLLSMERIVVSTNSKIEVKLWIALCQFPRAFKQQLVTWHSCGTFAVVFPEVTAGFDESFSKVARSR